ncbi:hypothetical protein AD07_1042 [Escherichia coli 8-415-05_S4_C2]|nr:hypothetical protein AD07_1042 [Escherichia coli 8-415-05_S4_C2]
MFTIWLSPPSKKQILLRILESIPYKDSAGKTLSACKN